MARRRKSKRYGVTVCYPDASGKMHCGKAGPRLAGSRKRRYSLGDFTEDSLESAQMNVIRASHQKDCRAAEIALKKLNDMGSFVVRQDAKREKSVTRLLRDSERYTAKACKR